MSLQNYSEFELSKLAQANSTDENITKLVTYITQVICEFESAQLNNMDAMHLLSVLPRLLRFKPLTPLTGEPNEWEEIGLGVFQNKRCSSVIQFEDGHVIDRDQFVVSDDGGLSWYTSNKFKSDPIKFPYYPPTYPAKIYIEYMDTSNPSIIENITDKPKRITELRNRIESTNNPIEPSKPPKKARKHT